MEVAALIASIVSIIISGFAIWLSITFYRMSVGESAKTTEAANEIASGVKRLDDLFDRLYADTFGMMKDTLTDMRKHIWPDSKGNYSVDSKEYIVLKKKIREEIGIEFRADIKRLLEEQNIDRNKSNALEKGLAAKASNILATAQERVEKALNERSKEVILSNIAAEGSLAQQLFGDFTGKYGFSTRHFFPTMKLLRSQGLITWEGKSLRPDSIIMLCDKEKPQRDEKH